MCECFDLNKCFDLNGCCDLNKCCDHRQFLLFALCFFLFSFIVHVVLCDSFHSFLSSFIYSTLYCHSYFRALDLHKKEFREGIHAHEPIDLAFNKSRSKDRKHWLTTKYDPSSFIDPTHKSLTYSDFVANEFIHFSHADNQRSIPSAIDGLKPSQRKILYGCFKRKLDTEMKVNTTTSTNAFSYTLLTNTPHNPSYNLNHHVSCTRMKVVQLAGYIAEKTCYHHGEVSLHNTIINMAQVQHNHLPYP